MAKLDQYGRIISSGPGMGGLRQSWRNLQDWLGIEIVVARNRLGKIIK